MISDYNLPGGMNGAEAFQQIRVLMPGVHLVMITGWPLDEVIPNALAAKPLAIFEKPVEYDQTISDAAEGPMIHAQSGMIDFYIFRLKSSVSRPTLALPCARDRAKASGSGDMPWWPARRGADSMVKVTDHVCLPDGPAKHIS